MDDNEHVQPDDDAFVQDEPAVSVDLSRFSPCARAALERAADEARRFGDPYVGTDHVLLAIAADDAAAAQQVLTALEMDRARLDGLMRFIRGGELAAASGTTEAGLSPRLQRVLAAATKDATKRSHDQIGTLHLLTGLLREKAGLAVFLLESPGVGLERAGGAIARAHRDGLADG